MLSLRRYNSEPIAIFTDHPKLSGLSDAADFIYEIRPKHVRAKIDYIHLSPFDKTFYLDSDTIIVQNISNVFELLSKFDVAVTFDPARKRKNISYRIKKYASIPYSFSEANGGIMAFNSSEETQAFLSSWRRYFYKYFVESDGWDQPSLRIALWETSARIAWMPQEFNVRSRDKFDKVERLKKGKVLSESHMEPRIYHMHYSNDVHKSVFDFENLSDLENVIKDKAFKIKY